MTLRFIDLFAGLGGFHIGIQGLGFTCVFASESDNELRDCYVQNFPAMRGKVYGDIREAKNKVPPHDILCAGFPCQPFSKSGSQAGWRDTTRGTLFYEILAIIEKHRPSYLFLENVGNFQQHDGGRTWQVVRESLEELGYTVRATEPVKSNGPGLLSPHHLGFPHSRERFYIVAHQGPLLNRPFPIHQNLPTSLSSITQDADDLTPADRSETHLTLQREHYIEHWNTLLASLPDDQVDLPSFPIWGDELDARYSFERSTPFRSNTRTLRAHLQHHIGQQQLSREDLLAMLPSYAQTPTSLFPKWKQQFIRQNREWFTRYREWFPSDWVEILRGFPDSMRKLEWNCKGEERDLWKHVLQFRPSGIRAKRYSASPALVAMTTTQIPILGPHRRFLTRIEGLRLQGFPDTHRLPRLREHAFRALGNAVHAGVVEAIARCIFEHSTMRTDLMPEHTVTLPSRMLVEDEPLVEWTAETV